jgi:hypothetical protein
MADQRKIDVQQQTNDLTDLVSSPKQCRQQFVVLFLMTLGKFPGVET